MDLFSAIQEENIPAIKSLLQSPEEIRNFNEGEYFIQSKNPEIWKIIYTTPGIILSTEIIKASLDQIRLLEFLGEHHLVEKELKILNILFPLFPKEIIQSSAIEYHVRLNNSSFSILISNLDIFEHYYPKIKRLPQIKQFVKTLPLPVETYFGCSGLQRITFEKLLERHFQN